MSLTPEQVRHIARLARIGLDDTDIDVFSGQLSEILDYFERLRQVDTDGIPPTAHTLDLHNVMRDDDPLQGYDPETILANAPLREGQHFRVRAILEE